MKLADLLDDFTPEQFMQLDKESLDKIPYERKKWFCQCKGCTGGTFVRDYGIGPWYWLDRNSKWANSKPAELWSNLTKHYWLCSKHNERVRKMIRLYGQAAIEDKVLDFSKLPEERLIKVPMNELKKLPSGRGEKG